jgi:molybdenum storage protein
VTDPVVKVADPRSGDELMRGGSRHVESLLMKDSLLSKETQQRTEAVSLPLVPFARVVKIGGRIIDGGSETLLPVVDELREALTRHKLIIGAGSGIRSRHVFSVGLDLGLPTGVLAALSATDAEQNAHILGALLARDGVVSLPPPLVTHLLPALLVLGNGVVVNGVPPFELWEHPPSIGRIPPNRTDVGMYLLAEIYGVERAILVKDVDGLFTSDPTTDPDATHVPYMTVEGLVSSRPQTLPFDELLLELMPHGHHCRQVQIVDGTKPGMLTRALAGEPVGTVIEATGRRDGTRP